ncbi:L,D-transpeptidase [Conexibacter arvalis]|uniref:Lipoprotein-anchoring transpeptidase ErfK/SrfK n=1 Tax=Conexibacter arvalis TaxID=912552 RepID=A0A840IE23_9ACTN|nr:L,D-transpeptidase [Conexibacter arvalis]MBB4662190.1 lipoprotein-anchoring transpeptidase ErfK/SrfK [Conexibacter arvalis]
MSRTSTTAIIAARAAALLALAGLLAATASTAASASAPATGVPAAPTAGAWIAAARTDAPVRPIPRRGATVAKIVAPVMARAAPDVGARAVWRVPTATGWSRQAQVLLVLRSKRDQAGRRWLKVVLPIRPNGTRGWIRADYVQLRRTRYWIDVSTARRLVTVRRAGRVVRRFRAVVGAPGTPTPHGLFAIWERNRQPDPGAFLGPWALSLTALSNVLENYGGGPGRVAIHGRAGLSLNDPLGSARSHGCIRVANADVSWLAHRVPAGTPVAIRR